MQSTPSTTLSVVICCFTVRRRDQVLAAVGAALAQVRAGDEVLVVVDHNDELRADLTAALPPEVLVLANGFEQGLSGARNTGLHKASGDVVVYLDDDAVLRPDALTAARREFVSGTGVLGIGGAVAADWATGQPPQWFPDEFGWVVGCDYRGLPGDGEEIRNPIGAAMAVRRDALAEIGGFSDRLGRVGELPMGCEETLMGIALRQRFPGKRIVRVTGFGVTHAVPADRASLRYFTRRCFQEGRSKAILTRMSGADSALASERNYATSVLPAGLRRYRISAAAVALAVGFGMTATGFLVGLLQTRAPARVGKDLLS